MNEKLYKQQWSVPSASGEKPHKVSLKHTGDYVCDCWPFRKERTCRHIDEVKDGLHNADTQRIYHFQPGNVQAVKICKETKKEITFLYPLIPLDPRATHLDATIVYDLLITFKVPLAEVKKLNRNVLRANSSKNIIEYVRSHGRMIWREYKNGRPDIGVQIIPISQGESHG